MNATHLFRRVSSHWSLRVATCSIARNRRLRAIFLGAGDLESGLRRLLGQQPRGGRVHRDTRRQSACGFGLEGDHVESGPGILAGRVQ